MPIMLIFMCWSFLKYKCADYLKKYGENPIGVGATCSRPLIGVLSCCEMMKPTSELLVLLIKCPFIL